MPKLNKCIYIIKLLKQRGKMTRQEINDEMSRRWPDEQELSRSSFGRYLEFIRMNFPFTVSFSQATKLYSLNYKGVDKGNEDIFQYLLSMFDIEASAPLLLKHQDRIHRIEDITGTDKLDIILQAIDKHRGVECDYQSFTRCTKKHRIFIPVFLTSWEGRWYCVAEVTTHPESEPYTYALERMSDIRLTREHYYPRYKGAYNDYFKDSYGIQGASHDDTPFDIVIKAYGAQVGYLRSKPIHPSQEELVCKEENDNVKEATFKFHLTPCYNFYQQLLWHRESIEVLEPQDIRDDMKRITEKINNRYIKE